MNQDPMYLVLDCTRIHVSKISVDMACDLIDRCYAEASNPDGDYFIRSRQAYRQLLSWVSAAKNAPLLSDEHGEVFAYIRAFPLLESVPEEAEFDSDSEYQKHRHAVADRK